MADFRFYHPIEVRYGDLDPQGHVNNARYLTYLEQARICLHPPSGVMGWEIILRNWNNPGGGADYFSRSNPAGPASTGRCEGFTSGK